MQTSFSGLEFATKKKQSRRERFLDEIDVFVPWGELMAVIAPFYPKSGGPREDAPDATTVLHFRYHLEAHGLTRGPFAAIKDHLAASGLMIKEGTIVDAGSGLVHSLVAMPANVSDVTKAHDLLHGEESLCFGDAGYQSVEKRPYAGTNAVRRDVAMPAGKRRGLIDGCMADTRLGRLTERMETLKASIRAEAEHPFHIIKNKFGLKRTRYKDPSKNADQFFILFGLANLIIAKKSLLVTAQ